MYYKEFKDGIKLSRLGMGNMRLPLVDPKDPKSPIDWTEAHKIIDRAYESGINYFDTAYVYNNGESEKCLGECMKKHPRESFYYATKFNIAANPDYKAVFEEELERLQTDYIDFYLIHCILDNRCDNYIESGCIEYFKEMKKQGKIRYLGFSSHAGVETLRKFADYTDWDFAQLQVNYFDWNYSKTKEEYKILEERNIPMIVMEPVRGGRLSNLSDDAEAILKNAHPDWSISSWALRFVQSLPNTLTVLSGMSTLGQLDDNLNTFACDSSLNDEDKKTLFEACDKFHSHLVVPCTSCRYCTDAGCPTGINIPEWLKVYNTLKVEGAMAAKSIAASVDSEGKPEDCIGCGLCASQCPQSIDIPTIMKELAEELAK